jgi:hypothetical protein
MRRVNGYTIFLLAVLGLSGLLCLIYATRCGVGIHPNSVVYVSAARSLLAGHALVSPPDSGTSKPMSHFGPLYPTLLAAIGLSGVDPLDGARWLNALIFAANIVGVGLLIAACSGGSTWTPVAGSLLALSSVPMLGAHATALTEPLFILLGFLGLFLLAAYFESSELLFLFASSFATGLAFLDRYAGAAFIVTGVAGLFLFSRRGFARRLIDALSFSALSSSPMTLWLIRNLRGSGTATDRTLAFHPISVVHAKQALSTILQWTLPDRQVLSTFALPLLVNKLPVNAKEILFGAGVTLLASYFLLLQRSKWINGVKSTVVPVASLAYPPRLLLLFVPLYLLFLCVSMSLFDAQTLFNDRILLPVYVSGLVLTPYLALCLLRSSEGIRPARVMLILFCSAFLVSHLLRGSMWLVKSHNKGISMGQTSFGTEAWHNSETLARTRSLAPAVPLYSNASDAIYILTGRPALIVPKKVDPTTRKVNQNYPSELAGMKERLEKEDGVMVYFSALKGRPYLPREEELVETLPLEIVFRGSDGTIYGVHHRKN